MTCIYKAPIDDADVGRIVACLTETTGRDRAWDTPISFDATKWT